MEEEKEERRKERKQVKDYLACIICPNSCRIICRHVYMQKLENINIRLPWDDVTYF